MSHLIDLLEDRHIVRLTGFRFATQQSATALAEFTAAWTAFARSAAAPGILYRELNRQMPEWTQLAAAEIDHPLDFSFLEYIVLESGTPTDTLPSFTFPGSEAVTGFYKVDFRLIQPSVAGRPQTLMFNLFELNGPPAMQQAFLMNWVPRGEFKVHDTGIFSSLLHERLLPSARFAAFNRVEVLDAATYAAGIQRFEAAFPRSQRVGPPHSAPGAPGTPPVVSHLGLFRQEAVILGAAPTDQPTMQAVIAHDYGPPEVLVVSHVPRPAPGPGQILVRVKACSINPLDVKMRSGEVRTIYPSWFPEIYGYSVSGIIVALGEGVSDRQVGEEVYGINNPIRRHGYAEFVTAPSSFFYPKPPAMDWPTAAAAPSIFATAFGALFGRANLQPGQRILIHGGAGVIGSCAVQLAKQAGAFVYATASAQNLEALKTLGADVAIDYRAQRFEEIATHLDMVLDTVGGETRDRSYATLRPGGVLATLLPPPPDEADAQRRGVQAFMVHGHPNIGEIMPEMTCRLITGELQYPAIAATYPLQQAAQAHAAYERKTPQGRIVLTIE